MRFYSTNNPGEFTDLRTAVLKGLPDDNGLYMPERIDRLPDSFLNNLENYSLPEIAFEISRHLLGEVISEEDLKGITERAINFLAPLKTIHSGIHILELFHGPSLAFKDFGARFMAQLMGYFNRGEDRKLTILVATSGDTGGAVAAGFHNTPGIDVVILYPKGKVSDLQEKQLTTLGGNISALRVDGTFDDCQALVKRAFLDQDLNRQLRLSSANSINISRLIPQSFYYFEAYKKLTGTDQRVSFCVPSGNFGNLTAGILAKKMGLPVHKFIAATNANDVVPGYLSSGKYEPRPSVRTLSNAMDVGAPSNFARMMDLYGSTWNIIKDDVFGFAFSDEETEEKMREVLDRYNYLLDPHGAVGYLAAEKYRENHHDDAIIILETAHPGKFIGDVERIIGRDIELPTALSRLKKLKGDQTDIPNNYEVFKAQLLN